MSDQTPRMPDLWWCPTHGLYRGGKERPCADAERLGKIDTLKRSQLAAEDRALKLERMLDEIRIALDDSGDYMHSDVRKRLRAIVGRSAAAPESLKFTGQGGGTPPTNPCGPADEPCPTCDWHVSGCDWCCGPEDKPAENVEALRAELEALCEGENWHGAVDADAIRAILDRPAAAPPEPECTCAKGYAVCDSCRAKYYPTVAAAPAELREDPYAGWSEKQYRALFEQTPPPIELDDGAAAPVEPREDTGGDRG